MMCLLCVVFFYPWQSGKFGSAVEEILLHACQVASTVIGARKSKMNYIHSPIPLGSLVSMHYYTGPQMLQLQGAQRMQAGEKYRSLEAAWRRCEQSWVMEGHQENSLLYCTFSIMFLKLSTALSTQQRPTLSGLSHTRKQVGLFPDGSIRNFGLAPLLGSDVRS